jgi:hypothetical protein
VSIVLGKATLTGNAVTLSPPEGGFGGITAARITNYTGDVIIITNISSDSPGQEYLMPFQQNVYHIENVRTPPTAAGVQLGAAFATATLLVEWSNDPLKDFPGTYPTALTQAGIISSAAPKFNVAEVAIPADAATHTIPANPARTGLSFIVDGANAVEWNDVDSGWGTNPQAASGTGRTVDTASAVYFRATGGVASSVQYWETTY